MLYIFTVTESKYSGNVKKENFIQRKYLCYLDWEILRLIRMFLFSGRHDIVAKYDGISKHWKYYFVGIFNGDAFGLTKKIPEVKIFLFYQVCDRRDAKK